MRSRLPSVVAPTRALALFRLVLLQRLFEERVLALYRQGRIAGLGLHRPRPGGGRRGRRARARAGRRRRAAQPRARLPLRARRRRSRTSSATSSARRRARRSAATGTCTSACPSAASSRSSRCSATSCPVVVGAALAFKRRGEPRVAMTFLGEGAFSVGDTHEGLNLAAVWQVPAVFVIQSQPVLVLDAGRAADGEHEHRRADRAAAGRSPPSASTAPTRSPSSTTVRAAVERARAGERPAGGRGALAAAARPRRPRRRALRARGRCARSTTSARPGRAAGRAPRARRPLGDDARGLPGRGGGRGRRGLAEAEQAPAPDPATLEDGVYASPVE